MCLSPAGGRPERRDHGKDQAVATDTYPGLERIYNCESRKVSRLPPRPDREQVAVELSSAEVEGSKRGDCSDGGGWRSMFSIVQHQGATSAWVPAPIIHAARVVVQSRETDGAARAASAYERVG